MALFSLPTCTCRYIIDVLLTESTANLPRLENVLQHRSISYNFEIVTLGPIQQCRAHACICYIYISLSFLFPDPFEKACFAVAMYIETDWPKLYRALPFHPQRGKNTIDQDIGELTNEASRTSTQQTALRALYRWRRHHTRAKLEDLKETLSLIKKVEVLDKLEKTLNPPVEPPKEEPKITYVEEYLIPFAKEVERFDELRAANKI